MFLLFLLFFWENIPLMIVDVDIQRQQQEAGGNAMETEGEDPVPEITRVHFEEAMAYARRSVSDNGILLSSFHPSISPIPSHPFHLTHSILPIPSYLFHH